MYQSNSRLNRGVRFGLFILILIAFTLPVHAVVGAVEVVASLDNNPLPGARITILQGDEVVQEEDADRSGVALIPLEEGEYTVLIDSPDGTVKDTVTVGAGQLVSVTGDVAHGTITLNSQPLDRYRHLDTEKAEKGYDVSLADLGGLVSYRFTTPEGSIFLGFPYYTVAGETVSFRAIQLPSGMDAKELDKNTKKLSEYYFTIDDQKYSLKKSESWNFEARMESEVNLVSGKNKTLIEVKADFRLQPWSEQVLAGFGEDTVYFANANWPICIPGEFDGIASNTEVYYGDTRMDVVAETPSSVIFNPPSSLPGLHGVRILEGENTFRCFVRAAHVQLSIDRDKLWTGESTELHLKVLGLEELKTAYVSLLNLTPSIINISGGNYRFFIINPEDVGEGGVASYDLSVRGTKRGYFNINAILTER